MGEYEVPDVRGDGVIGQIAVGLRNAFLREAEHRWPFVDEQLSQPECGAGFQRRCEDAVRFVSVAGCGQAERKLDRGV